MTRFTGALLPLESRITHYVLRIPLLTGFLKTFYHTNW